MAQVHRPMPLAEKPKIAVRTQAPSELSTILAKLSLLETKVVSLEKRLETSDKRSVTFSDNVTKAITDASKKTLAAIEGSLQISRDDMGIVVDAVNKHTTASVQEIVGALSSLEMPGSEEDVPIAEGEVIIITPNNPYEGVHKSTIDEVVSMIADGNIYTCSSLKSLKEGIEIARGENIGAIKEDEAARDERLVLGSD
ncbi:unnamed protein product [Calypogeia fissa]